MQISNIITNLILFTDNFQFIQNPVKAIAFIIQIKIKNKVAVLKHKQLI